MRKTRSSGLPVLAATVAVLVIAAEVLLRTLFPIADPYAAYKHINQYIRSEFPQNYFSATEIEPGLPGMRGRHSFSTNSMGFRGEALVMPKPSDEYRIFLVGGSSAECLYLDDSESIDRILQEELGARNPARRIRVYNAGKSGDASDDHVSMIVHRIVHLSPDMIIVFCGFNDLLRAIYSYDYLHYVRTDELKLLKLLSTEFQIARRIVYLTKIFGPSSDRSTLEIITPKTRYKEKVDLRRSRSETDTAPRTDVAPYGINLGTMVGVAESHGIDLLLMTQQTTWNSSVDPGATERHWMRYQNGVTYREDLMDAAMTQLNNTMREVAEKHSVPVFDLALRIPKSLEYFYDDVHFNVKGARTAGMDLAFFIAESKPIYP